MLYVGKKKRGKREIRLCTKLCKLLEKHLPKPLKMDYFGVGSKREVVVLEMRVLMQEKSAHLDIFRKSYEFLNKQEFCSKTVGSESQQL